MIEIPDFVLQNLNEGKPVSETDQNTVRDILSSVDSFKYDTAGTEAQWLKFKAQITDAQTTVVEMPKTNKRQFAMFRWVAAAVIVLVAGLAIKQFSSGSDLDYIASYSTEAQHKTIKLSDGTEIILNANTEIHVKNMNSFSRELEMVKGEAFFKVVHNNSPFFVTTPKGTIKVLGTEFNVNAYSNQKFSVFLKKGKIEMTIKKEKIVLKPGQCLEEQANNNFALVSLSDNRNYAWIDNKLMFENTSLSEVVSVLEDTYKVKFVYDTQMKDEKISLSIDGLTANQVAEILSKTLNSKVSVQ